MITTLTPEAKEAYIEVQRELLKIYPERQEVIYRNVGECILMDTAPKPESEE